jgi:hypothetical protein
MPAPKKVTALPSKKGPGSDEPFVFTSSLTDDEDNPVVFTVPSLAVIPKPNQFKLLRLQKSDPSGVLATDLMLEAGIGRDLMDQLEELPGDESDKFMKDWADHSGVSLGESKASS